MGIKISPVNEIHELLICINRSMILGRMGRSERLSKVAVVPKSDGVVVGVFAMDESLDSITTIIQNEARKRSGQLRTKRLRQGVLT